MNKDYKKADAAVAGPTNTMPNQDVAAFLAMLFWMDDSTANTYTPFASFKDQVAAIQAGMQSGLFPKSKLFLNIQTINNDPKLGPMLQSVQQSIGGMMQAISGAGLWDGCLSVSSNQVSTIAKL